MRNKITTTIKKALKMWDEDRTEILAAALSYHLVFAIFPILLVIISILGYFYSSGNLDKMLQEQLENNFNPEIKDFILSILDNFITQDNPRLTNIIGSVLILFSAAGLVGFLKKALNQVWQIKVKKYPLKIVIWHQLRNMLLILGLGGLLVVSSLISRIIPIINQFYDVSSWLWLLNEILGIFTATLIIFSLVKVLVEKKIEFIPTLKGSVITAILMYLGRILIDYYFNFFNPSSAFGAAGALVLFLIWIYYSAHLFFFGIQIIKVLNSEEEVSQESQQNGKEVENSKKTKNSSKFKKIKLFIPIPLIINRKITR